MKPKLVIVIVFLAVAVAAYFAIGRKQAGGSGGSGGDGGDREAAAKTTEVARPAAPDASAPDASTIELPFEYSTEKKEWLEAAVADFARKHPEIHVQLIGKGSLESANAIVDGTDHPVLWSPADSLVVNLAAADWQAKRGAPMFAAGDAGPQPLVLSPLVLVAWDKRVHGEANNQLSWKTMRKSVSPTGAVRLALGQTDPNKSNSGLSALVGMTYEYFGVNSGLSADQLMDPRFVAYVRDIEAGVPQFEASTGTLMTDMIRFGPSKYDVAVVYESVAVSQIERAQGRWGNLHIYYPPNTMWSDHPAVVLDAAWVRPAQKAAAQQLVSFLRSTEVQQTALQFGFRPADESVAMKSTDPSNPFTKNAKYGLSLELPPAGRTPDSSVVRGLLMLWSRVTHGK